MKTPVRSASAGGQAALGSDSQGVAEALEETALLLVLPGYVPCPEKFQLATREALELKPKPEAALTSSEELQT